MRAIQQATEAIAYPDSDGKPMADNTVQFNWIHLLAGNLRILYRQRDDVFTGGNLLWYPVEGFDKIRRAPDAFVVIGRPPGDRGSYKQWEEDGVPMTVVFEIRSPKDSNRLMRQKLKFYNEYGVSEYYIIDPERNTLLAYQRPGSDHLLGPVRLVQGSVTSRRLGIRLEVRKDDIAVFNPKDAPFLSIEQIDAQQEQERQQAERDRQQAERDRQQAERDRQQAERDRLQATRLADLGRRARRGQASAEELAELDRLEDLMGSPTQED